MRLPSPGGGSRMRRRQSCSGGFDRRGSKFPDRIEPLRLGTRAQSSTGLRRVNSSGGSRTTLPGLNLRSVSFSCTGVGPRFVSFSPLDRA